VGERRERREGAVSTEGMAVLEWVQGVLEGVEGERRIEGK
jgi:hypothetical protein